MIFQKTKVSFLIFVFFCLFIFGKASGEANYSEELMFSVNVDVKNPISEFTVDQNENIYALHPGSSTVEIFDKNGKLLKSFAWDQKKTGSNCFLKVDEQENILICPRNLSGRKAVIYDTAGRQTNSFNMNLSVFSPNQLLFHNGSLYHQRNGKALYEKGINESARRRTLNNYEVQEKSKKDQREVLVLSEKGKLKFRNEVDGYFFGNILEVDDQGNFYCLYHSPPKVVLASNGTRDRTTFYRIYVFDGDAKLIGALKVDSEVDPSFYFVLKNQNFYEMDTSDNLKFMFYRWKK